MVSQRKPRSPETCRKLAIANTGKVFSAERRANIGKARIIHLPQETVSKLEEYWEKRYVPAKWIMKTLKISSRVYLRYLKTRCKHEQIKFLPQDLEPEIFETIIQKCRQRIPYLVISQDIGLKHRQVYHIILKLQSIYEIEPINSPIKHTSNHTPEHRITLAARITEYNKQNPKKKEQNPNWRGGTSILSELVRVLLPYKKWHANVLKRDKYACLLCGCKRHLHVDHIYPLSLLLRDGKITVPEEALTYSPMWDLSNGRTLCETCHKKTDTYGKQRKTYENRTI